MTEKRFTQRLYETGERFLEDNKTNCFYEIKDSFGNVELLCERLNKIVDENEQLKQQLNRLYNYFEDWYRDMTSANDFSEIWDNVKEDERWEDKGDVE